MLMAAKLKNVLIPKDFEDLGTIVIQFVGEGQNGVENPHHGHGKTLHGAGIHGWCPTPLGTTIKAYNKQSKKKENVDGE